jgi:hypothetical protein
VVSVLNSLSTMPWRRVGEWIYRSMFSCPALVGHEWLASCPCHFFPGERVTGTHWIESCVDLRAGLDNIQMWKFLTQLRLKLSSLFIILLFYNRKSVLKHIKEKLLHGITFHIFNIPALHYWKCKHHAQKGSRFQCYGFSKFNLNEQQERVFLFIYGFNDRFWKREVKVPF